MVPRATAAGQSLLDEPVELFPILMVALLVLLAAENLLANWFYGREMT